MPTSRLNRAKRLAAEPHTGHNRYHPDIPPVVEIGEGEEVALETRALTPAGYTGRTVASTTVPRHRR